jgi:hypothetical protein
MLDMVSKNRQAKGEKCGSAKLSAADVDAIRDLRSKRIKIRLIAEQFGISMRNVYYVLTRSTWKHVSDAN